MENTGNRDGSEIVQLYINDVISSLTTPIKELKGFEKIKLAIGEKKTVLFKLTPEHLSFLDIAPANQGHSLVIIKEHYETLADIPEDKLQVLIAVVQKVAKAVVKGVNAEGFNVFANNKKVAGQLVPHVHFHIVPRFSGDGINFDWPNKKYAEGEMDKVKDKIVGSL